jgi:hypothetical protein
MRYELSDYEWSVIRPILPNKSRGIPRVDDRRIVLRHGLGGDARDRIGRPAGCGRNDDIDGPRRVVLRRRRSDGGHDRGANHRQAHGDFLSMKWSERCAYSGLLYSRAYLDRTWPRPHLSPVTGIIACCPRAANGHAAAPPRSVMNSRRLTR